VLANGWTKEVYLFDARAVSTGGPIRARMFAPGLGIGEDPATGSAAACLAAYLAKHAADGAELSWTVEQGFEMGRPSIIELELERKRGSITAVRVGGASVMVSDGTMEIRA
jgi:trans-2,3-dihydro-3-hydroxyanthranilate isomerase